MPAPQNRLESATTRPPGRLVGVRRSARFASTMSTPPARVQPKVTTPTQSDTRQSEEPAGDAEPQEEDGENVSSVTDILGIISNALENTLTKHQMSDQLKKDPDNIHRYASKPMVKEDKKEIIQISIEDVRGLHKELLAELSGRYSKIENKVDSIASSRAHPEDNRHTSQGSQRNKRYCKGDRNQCYQGQRHNQLHRQHQLKRTGTCSSPSKRSTAQTAQYCQTSVSRTTLTGQRSKSSYRCTVTKCKTKAYPTSPVLLYTFSPHTYTATPS